MKTTDIFEEAYQEYQDDGGAMNYIQAGSDGPEMWQTGTCAEIREATGASPRDTTEDALYAGGLSQQEIDKQMDEWPTFSASDDCVRNEYDVDTFAEAVAAAREDWENATAGTYDVCVVLSSGRETIERVNIIVTAR